MFELSDALLRQIIFAMENQNNRYVVDTELGVLVRVDTLENTTIPDPDEAVLDITRRYQPLPKWTSADGFQLMERFLAELHNPIARNTLQEILISGKGVFRRFKDSIREYPEVEKRYYRFKHVEMRREVTEWYARLRELAGLDPLEIGADQELDDLVLTDITITQLAPGDPLPELLPELDLHACDEAWAHLPAAVQKHLHRTRAEGIPALSPGGDNPGLVLYLAKSPLEYLCGFLRALQCAPPDPALSETAPPGTVPPDPAIIEIHQLFVLPEFRGLGIARALLDRLVQDARQERRTCILSRLPGSGPATAALTRSQEFEEVERICLGCTS